MVLGGIILRCIEEAGLPCGEAVDGKGCRESRESTIYHPHSSSSSGGVVRLGAALSFLTPTLAFAGSDGCALICTGIITSPHFNSSNPPRAVVSASSSSSNDTDDDDWCGVIDPELDEDEYGGRGLQWLDAGVGLYDADCGDNNADAMDWVMSERSNDARFWPIVNLHIIK